MAAHVAVVVAALALVPDGTRLVLELSVPAPSPSPTGSGRWCARALVATGSDQNIAARGCRVLSRLPCCGPALLACGSGMLPCFGPAVLPHPCAVNRVSPAHTYSAPSLCAALTSALRPRDITSGCAVTSYPHHTPHPMSRSTYSTFCSVLGTSLPTPISRNTDVTASLDALLTSPPPLSPLRCHYNLCFTHYLIRNFSPCHLALYYVPLWPPPAHPSVKLSELMTTSYSDRPCELYCVRAPCAPPRAPYGTPRSTSDTRPLIRIA